MSRHAEVPQPCCAGHSGTLLCHPMQRIQARAHLASATRPASDRRRCGIRALAKCTASVLLLVGVVQAAYANGYGHPGITNVIETGIRTDLTFDWAKAGDSTARLEDVTITDETVVGLVITNVNFFRYTVTVEAKKEAVESYRLLESLWGSAFSLGTRFGLTQATEDSLDFWAVDIEGAAVSIESFLNRIGDSVVLDRKKAEADLRETFPDGTSLNDRIARLILERKDAWTQVKARSDSALRARYEDLLPKHESVLERLRALERARAMVDSGMKHTLGSFESGTLVTVTLTPKAADRTEAPSSARGSDEASGSKVVSFFVAGDPGLVLHVGYTYSTLDDFKFESVRTAAGEDLFTRIRNEEDTDELAVFLGYALLGANNDWQLLASLGTDVKSPGDRYYAGATAAYRGGGEALWLTLPPVHLTLGVAFAKVANPGDLVTSAVVEGSGARELFEDFQETLAAEFFMAITLGYR